MDVTQVNKGLPSIEAHLVFINNLFIQLLHFDLVADHFHWYVVERIKHWYLSFLSVIGRNLSR